MSTQGNVFKFRNQDQKSRYASRRSQDQLKGLDDISFDDRATSTSGQTAIVEHQLKNHASAVSNSPGRANMNVDTGWSPSPYSAFKLLVSARFAAALWSVISDCDETFNYWEPMHYLVYGKGFQTWEYSPEFALRSYTYLLFFALPAKIYEHFLHPNPILVFFLIRCCLGFVAACAEVFLYRSVQRVFGGNISRIAIVTSLFAPGMFISSTALLPSSFSSYMTALAIGAWLDELYELSIFAVAVSTLLSWPFAALTGVLIALDIVILQRQIIKFVKWSLISLVVVLLPLIYIDSTHYNKWVVAPWNIVKYNILSSKGPDLYGTEPWTFYAINGFLNFNITFVMALASPILALFTIRSGQRIKEKFLIIGTMLIWVVVFVLQPHKEERFLFPVYPLIPVCGAIGIASLQQIILEKYNSLTDLTYQHSARFYKWLRNRDIQTWLNGLGFLLIFTSNLIGCSRVVALHYGYRAPFEVFFNLHRDGSLINYETQVGDGELTLCFGKEWYRFPSSFFLTSTKWNTRFIESDFKGQLPNLYPPFDPEGTMKVPDHMNDLNAEEASRYILLEDCDFLVDSIDPNQITPKQPNYAANTEEWKVISEQQLISPGGSHPLFRAFYIPYLSDQYTKYKRYVILQRTRNLKLKKVVSSPKVNRQGKEFSDPWDDDL